MTRLANGLIEIVLRPSGWNVWLSREWHATFATPAQAVAFAQRLSDAVAPQGRSPRIRVYLSATADDGEGPEQAPILQ